MLTIERIQQNLQQNPDAKFGFVIYRCTYSDDGKWNRFMEYLNARAKSSIQSWEAPILSERLDWNIQEDPSLDGADMAEVRKRFRQWVSERSEVDIGSPRHRAFVVVTEQMVSNIIDLLNRGEIAPEKFDRLQSAWVWLVSKKGEDLQYNDEDEDEDEDDDDDADDDEDEEEDKKAEDAVEDGNVKKVEDLAIGPTDEVCYVRIGISYLVPRSYELLQDSNWYQFELMMDD